MAAFKDLSNALSDEVLNDMADNFFGARKDLDDILEYFELLSKQLSAILDEVYKSCALLQKVCLGEAGYKEFWKYAGLNPAAFIFPDHTECADFGDTPSFSITTKGEYIKWFNIAYLQLAFSVEKYMHGVYANDGIDKGRKFRSLNRMDFYQFAEDINLKIEKVNTNTAPSDVLKFTKSLDPATVVKENITGCVGPQCADINNDMSFKPIEIESLGFPEFPDLRSEERNPSFVCKFCSKVYSNNKSQVKLLLEDLNENS